MQPFNFHSHVKNETLHRNAVSMQAKILLDGDEYIIIANPQCSSVAYRIATDDIQIHNDTDSIKSESIYNITHYCPAISRTVSIG